MFTHIADILDAAGDNAAVVVSIVFVAAVAESALGLGAILPGETVLVLAAVALGHGVTLFLAFAAAAAGAFVGDHIGFGLGRGYGARLADTRVVRAVGRGRWDAAIASVRRRGFWLIVVARLLPGVRTLVSAAAGASGLSYRRFATATGTASVAWSLLWVVGGGSVGIAFLEYAETAAVPVAASLAAVVVVFGFRRLRRSGRKNDRR